MDLFLATLSALAMCPLVLANVIACCCGCQWCSDSTPTQYQVVIAGMANFGCSDCADLNATYILDLDPSFPGGCTWSYTFDPICSSPFFSSFSKIVLQSQQHGMVCEFYAGSDRVQWRYLLFPDEAHDCVLSSFSLAYFLNDSIACDATSATCVITAL